MRTKIALIVFLGFCLFSHFPAWKQIPPGFYFPENSITRYEQRFEKIRASLPPGTRIGFYSDAPDGSTDAIGRFYVAQYALVPAIVTPPEKSGWIIGDFSSKESLAATLQSKHWTLAGNTGNGLVLLKKTESAS